MPSPKKKDTKKAEEHTQALVAVTFDIGSQEGHHLPRAAKDGFVDSRLMSEFQAQSHHGEHPLVIAYNKEHAFTNMAFGDSEIPGFEGVELANKRLVELVIEQEAWPKTSLALENLLLQAYAYNLGEEYTGKIEALLLNIADTEYTAPDKRDMPGLKKESEPLADAVPFLGFIDLQDKRLVELVIETKSWPNNNIALENLLRNAKRLGLDTKYITSVSQALKEAPVVDYTQPEKRYLTYKAGTDAVEDSLDRALAAGYDEFMTLAESDQRMAEMVESSRASWESYKHKAAEPVKRTPASDLYEPAEDYMDGILAADREYSPEVVKADEKLTTLVVRTKSLPASLTALDNYLKCLANLREGVILEFNSKRPGETFELEITSGVKEDLKAKVLKKADEIIPHTLSGLSKYLDKIWYSRVKGPIKHWIKFGIAELKVQ